MEIKSIAIYGLFGAKDYRFEFSDNKLILVGENGSGKTTVSRIIYSVLSCNWDQLSTYQFEKIIISINDEEICISANEIKDIYSIPDVERIEFYLDRRGSRRNLNGLLSAIIETKTKLEKEKSEEGRELFKYNLRYIPYEYIAEIINNENINNLFSLTKKIQSAFSSKILYLPTYRRIEEQLRNIFPDLEREVYEKVGKRNYSDNSVEMVEFGMQDVERLVQKENDALKSLSQTQQNKLSLGYLSEIVSEKYNQETIYMKDIKQLSDDEISQVLMRIDQKILSNEMKDQILNVLQSVRQNQNSIDTTQTKIICHYFMKLVGFYNEITNAERDIRSFQDICNKYLVNNRIEYIGQDFSCQLLNCLNNEQEHQIRFQDLSSGEKQIVSLFSHLCLDKNEGIFVFIDEPELSLSVDWQKMFLPDIVKSPNCIGLIATTHSPFIFDNELEEYVHGINEFCIKG